MKHKLLLSFVMIGISIETYLNEDKGRILN